MFRFNPNAIEFIPQEQQILRQQPEFVQDLHALWDEVACAWEDEARAGRVLSWFVDQARGPQVCNEPRPVVLYDDPTRWQTEIRSVWADHVNVNAVNAPLEVSHCDSPATSNGAQYHCAYHSDTITGSYDGDTFSDHL